MIQRNKLAPTISTDIKERPETREETLRKSADEQKRLKSFMQGIKVGLEADDRLKYHEKANRQKKVNSNLQEVCFFVLISFLFCSLFYFQIIKKQNIETIEIHYQSKT